MILILNLQIGSSRTYKYIYMPVLRVDAKIFFMKKDVQLKCSVTKEPGDSTVRWPPGWKQIIPEGTDQPETQPLVMSHRALPAALNCLGKLTLVRMWELNGRCISLPHSNSLLAPTCSKPSKFSTLCCIHLQHPLLLKKSERKYSKILTVLVSEWCLCG